MAKSEFKGFRHGVRSSVCKRPTPLLEYVASELSLENTPPDLTALELLELGSVYIDSERCLNPSRVLKAGEEVRIHTSPRRFPMPADLASRIAAETEDSILVEKPAGLPSEPTVDNVKENLVSFLSELRRQSFFLTHRLEAESEGLQLLAKNANAAARISRSFSEGTIKRIYVAYVEYPVSPGQHIIAATAPSDRAGTLKILDCTEQKGETNLISERSSTWLIKGAPLQVIYRLEIEFAHLRPKQVREYLASLGSPILGDRVTGSKCELIESSTLKSAMAFRAISFRED